MYDLVEGSNNIGTLNSWLAFEDQDQFEPIQDGWVTVNRHGHHRAETSVGTVKQTFRIHGFLVDEDDLNEFLESDPFGEIPTFDFSPMVYGRRRGEGEYWEEDLTREVDGVEAKRFVMDF